MVKPGAAGDDKKICMLSKAVTAVARLSRLVYGCACFRRLMGKNA
jgi:hypothetical protein